mmetsp:Transcript_12201/g.52560  ORF Transcript_12201/g.52560 Transcript_12201/m.52560 type:complete len:263 (+) Transcript_12201:471-1259(+)
MVRPRRPAASRGAPQSRRRPRRRRQRRTLRRGGADGARRADGETRRDGGRRPRGHRRALRRHDVAGALVRRTTQSVGVRGRPTGRHGPGPRRRRGVHAHPAPHRASFRQLRVAETSRPVESPRRRRPKPKPKLARRRSRGDRELRRGRVQVLSAGSRAFGFSHRGTTRRRRRARARRPSEGYPLARGDHRARFRRGVDVVHRGLDVGRDANPEPLLRALLPALLGYRRHHRAKHGGGGDGDDSAGHRASAVKPGDRRGGRDG